jgi:K(+)-stimulated pyrophosphate-energized sodium pump
VVPLLVWLFSVAASLAAVGWAISFYRWMRRAEEGTPAMVSIAQSVRQGASAYLRQQNTWVLVIFLAVAGVLALASFGMELQSRWTPIAFLSGGLFSGLCGWFGMKTATWASSRTAWAASRSLNEGLQLAFRSGAVMGLTVVGMGLLYIALWFALLYWIVPRFYPTETLSLSQLSVVMLSFGMGASAQALFARVGGGIFTKAADVGADLVGKVEQSMAEDSPNNPATIADNVGDNVGDVAGMGADLYESYCGAILAAAALGVAAFANPNLFGGDAQAAQTAQLHALLLPLAISAAGIVLSIVGIYAVRTGEETSQRKLLQAIARGINLASVLTMVASVFLAWWLIPSLGGKIAIFGVPGIGISIIVGVVSGWLIGKWTEYSTSDEYGPTRRLAEQATTGPATIIIGGVAEGMLSTWFPVLIISAASLLAFAAATGWHVGDVHYFPLGLYGVGIAAVGMLSTLGITLATDAYGPIADNAGGNAEMAGLDKSVRSRTDALDSLGNTTAATGKGFAIGSAALTALALVAAYMESVRDGFTRWTTATSAQVSTDGLYKLSSGLLMERRDGVANGHLVLDQDLDRAGQWDAWQALDASEGPVAVPAGMISIASGSTGVPTVPVASATLRDFMHYYDATLMNPRVLVGAFLGAMATFLFCALTMKAVGRAAQGMVLEVRRQLKEKPGILQGTEKPDYERPIAISTKAALREMILPSLIGLLLPLAVGMVLSVGGVIGLLAGTLTTGFCVAVFMANSGGSWDNAKKYIEADHLGGKGSDAHKAAVVGDTVGDPFKDTSGPSLNILIKLMSMVSVVAAGLVVRYSLASMGWL